MAVMRTNLLETKVETYVKSYLVTEKMGEPGKEPTASGACCSLNLGSPVTLPHGGETWACMLRLKLGWRR